MNYINTLNALNTFHGIEPQLIANTTLEGIEAPLKLEPPKQTNKIFNGLGNFYSNYIAPNLFSLIVIIAFVIYLIINYIIKKDKKEKEKEKEKYIDLDELEDLEDLEEKSDNDISDISNYISDDYLITETE